MMDLIDRYLGAIRWNLPAAKADDIVAELSDVIANRIEEREDALGRPLTRDEVSTLLRDFGHPLEVAGRYHGQRVLIGPEVFPFYWFILQIVLVVVAAVALIQIAADAVTGSTPLVSILMQSAGHLFDSLLLNAAMVTLIFAVIEHTGLLARYLEKWNPEQLPRLRRKPAQRKRWSASFDAAVALAFLLWWIGLLHLPLSMGDSRIAITPTSIWAAFYLPIAIFAAARFAYLAMRMLRPNWRVTLTALGLASAIGGLAILAGLYPQGPWVDVASRTGNAAQAVEVARSLNLAIHYGLIATGIGIAIRAVHDVWDIFHR